MADTSTQHDQFETALRAWSETPDGPLCWEEVGEGVGHPRPWAIGQGDVGDGGFDGERGYLDAAGWLVVDVDGDLPPTPLRAEFAAWLNALPESAPSEATDEEVERTMDGLRPVFEPKAAPVTCVPASAVRVTFTGGAPDTQAAIDASKARQADLVAENDRLRDALRRARNDLRACAEHPSDSPPHAPADTLAGRPAQVAELIERVLAACAAAAAAAETDSDPAELARAALLVAFPEGGPAEAWLSRGPEVYDARAVANREVLAANHELLEELWDALQVESGQRGDWADALRQVRVERHDLGDGDSPTPFDEAYYVERFDEDVRTIRGLRDALATANAEVERLTDVGGRLAGRIEGLREDHASEKADRQAMARERDAALAELSTERKHAAALVEWSEDTERHNPERTLDLWPLPWTESGWCIRDAEGGVVGIKTDQPAGLTAWVNAASERAKGSEG